MCGYPPFKLVIYFNHPTRFITFGNKYCLICGLKVKYGSKYKPKYLTLFCGVIVVLLSVIVNLSVGGIFFLRGDLNTIYCVLFSANNNFHFVHHCEILLSDCCMLLC